MSFKKEREKLIGSFHGNCDMMTRHYLLQLHYTMCCAGRYRDFLSI